MIKHFSTDPYKFATHCLEKYIADKGWKTAEDIVIDIQDIYDSIIYPDYEVRLVTHEDLGYEGDAKILGKTIVTDDIILIDQSIAPNKNDRRYAITLAHEIGHALIHNERDSYLKYTADSIFDEHHLNELHADNFAEHLIMPHQFLGFRFVQHYGRWNAFTYKGPGDYFINKVNHYISSLANLYQKLAEPLTAYFSNVPTDILAGTMQRLHFVEDGTMKPIIESFLIEGSVLHNFAARSR